MSAVVTRCTLAICVVSVLGASTAVASADPPSSGPTPVFSIAKSENKNEVQYVVRLDDGCAPVGSSPVSAYWRMLERGPTQTAPLLPRETDVPEIRDWTWTTE